MKPDYFYDRHLKLWTLLWTDPEGNQIGEAEYFVNQELLEAGIDTGHHEHYKSYIKALKLIDNIRWIGLDIKNVSRMENLDTVLDEAKQRGINLELNNV